MQSATNEGGLVVVRTGGTLGTPSYNANGFDLGRIGFSGFDFETFGPSAGIAARTTQVWNATSRGTRLDFYTTQNSQTSAFTRMTINHNGDVGIGNPNPITALHIERNNSPAILVKENISTNGASLLLESLRQFMIISNESGYFRIQDNTAGEDRFTISPTGNVGINEPNPLVKLHINSTVSPAFRLEDGTQGVGKVLTSDANGNATWQNAAAGVTGTGTATQVAFWNSATSLSSNSNLYWENINGRLGVGTSTPQYRLTVAGDGSANLSSVFGVEAYGTGVGANTLAMIMRRAGGSMGSPTATSLNESLGTLGFQGHTGAGFSANLSSFMGAQATENWTAASNGSQLNFNTTPNGSNANVRRMNIASDGNILIGSGNAVAENNAITVSLINNSGAASVPGDIVVIGTIDNSFTRTATAGHLSVLGVVIDAVSNGALARVAISGVVTVNLDASAGVTRGQHCITGTTNGKASGIAIPAAGTSIGVYLSNGPASGTARVLLK